MMRLSKAQAGIAVPLLNSYAHQYLGLSPADIQVVAFEQGNEGWQLFVATPGEGTLADNFDAAKLLIDKIANGRAALQEQADD
jgi:hypothetical protein